MNQFHVVFWEEQVIGGSPKRRDTFFESERYINRHDADKWYENNIAKHQAQLKLSAIPTEVNQITRWVDVDS